MNSEHRHAPDRNRQVKSRAKWVLIGFFVIAGYFLVTGHRAHLAGWLSAYGIWLLLLACPLLHMFMHGAHGGHGSHGDGSREATNQPKGQDK
jgi:cell division protein FtsW (lipid II flippase)